MPAFNGWVVAETANGNCLEYWVGGKCLVSLPTDSEDFAVLERIQKLLNYVKALPPVAG